MKSRYLIAMSVVTAQFVSAVLDWDTVHAQNEIKSSPIAPIYRLCADFQSLMPPSRYGAIALSRADEVVDQIYSKRQLDRHVDVRLGNARVRNALATVCYNENRQLKPTIFINSEFLGGFLLAAGRIDAFVFVIAHEVAHILNKDTYRGSENSHVRECRADKFAGGIIAEQRYPEAAIVAALNAIDSREASTTHPELGARLTCAGNGWRAKNPDLPMKSPEGSAETELQTKFVRTATWVKAQNDLGKYENMTLPQCESRCAANPKCRQYELYRPKAPSPICHLYSKVHELKSGGDAVTGVRVAPSEPTVVSPWFLRLNSDVRAKEFASVPAKSIDQCIKACQQDASNTCSFVRFQRSHQRCDFFTQADHATVPATDSDVAAVALPDRMRLNRLLPRSQR
jgi:hypothetical protein